MQAPDYTPTTNFADDARNNTGGRDAVRTDRLDAELDAISDSINASNANLELIQRDDGKLRDQIVEPYNLSAAALLFIQGSKLNPRGIWAPGQVYEPQDFVDHLGDAFVCAIGHTSGIFAADYAAGYWQVFSSVPAAPDIEFMPTSTVQATDVQGAIEAIDAESRSAIGPLQSLFYGGL